MTTRKVIHIDPEAVEPEKIAIFVPDEDAKKFLLFQQHYNVFSLLLERGVFNQKSASVTLHFDQRGTLQVIDREDCLYNSRFE